VLGTAARATEPIHRSTQRPPSPHATVRYFVCAVHTWQLMARNSLFRRHNGQTARAYACWKMLPKLLAGAHHRIVLPAINTRTLTTHRRRMLSDALSLHIHTYTHTHIHTYIPTYSTATGRPMSHLYNKRYASLSGCACQGPLVHARESWRHGRFLEAVHGQGIPLPFPTSLVTLVSRCPWRLLDSCYVII
jgi:hypothetical protein